MSKRSSEYLINERRRQEAYREAVQGSVVQDKILKGAADWENKTYDRILENNVKREFEKLRVEDEQGLIRRRERLGHLLQAEQRQYQEELQSMTETADDRRQRVEARAKALREQREKERQETVEEKYQQRFRLACDPLREFDSKLSTMEATHARGVQLAEKQHRKNIEAVENEAFHEMWMEDIERKKQREIDDLERQKKINDDVKETLDEQHTLYVNRKKQEREDVLKLGEEMKRQWAEEKAAEEAAEIQRRIDLQKRNEQVQKFNRDREILRFQAEEKERNEDLERLNKVLQKEREEDEADLAWKQYKIQEANVFRDMLKEQMIREAQDESELEAMRQADQDRAWKKREDVWEREREARERLMKETLDGQMQQIEEKREELRQRRELTKKEMDGMEEQMAELERLEREDALAKQRERDINQNALLEQIKHKEDQRRLALENKQREKEAALEAEAEYQARLKAEMDVRLDKVQQYMDSKTTIENNIW